MSLWERKRWKRGRIWAKFPISVA